MGTTGSLCYKRSSRTLPWVIARRMGLPGVEVENTGNLLDLYYFCLFTQGLSLPLETKPCLFRGSAAPFLSSHGVLVGASSPSTLSSPQSQLIWLVDIWACDLDQNNQNPSLQFFKTNLNGGKYCVPLLWHSLEMCGQDLLVALLQLQGGSLSEKMQSACRMSCKFLLVFKSLVLSLRPIHILALCMIMWDFQ